MQGKVAVLGNNDFVMPFRAMGLETFTVKTQKQEVLDAAEKIVKENFTLVVVAENIAAFANTAFEQTNKNATPCVVTTPFTTESKGFAIEKLGKLLKIATGINILENN